jgi:hypothetical protein
MTIPEPDNQLDGLSHKRITPSMTIPEPDNQLDDLSH